MKQFKKAMTLLLVLSMLMMSGIFAFADGNALLQEDAVSAPGSEDVIQTEDHTPQASDNPSNEQENTGESQDTQQPEDTKETVSDDKSMEPADTQETEGEGENPSQAPLTTSNEIQGAGSTENTAELGSVTASVYLRYTNEVPGNIIQSYAPEGFGPAGIKGVPYFTVNVDLNKIEELCGQNKIQKCEKEGLTYYSAQVSLDQSVTKPEAVACWDAILQAVSDADKQKFIDYFGVSGTGGAMNFIGYVFKLEADGWHIDGILDVKPGYVTEFYLNNGIKKTDVAEEAMTTQDAKTNIEGMLGAESGTIKWNEDGMGGMFEQDNAVYRFTIRTDGDYSPNNTNVRYAAKIQNAYYLARIYVTTEKIGEKPTGFDVQAAYKVEHYWKTDSGYVLHETELLHGKIDTEVVAAAKDYSEDGYEVNAAAPGTVKTGNVTLPTVENGEVKLLTLKLYYDPVEPDPVTPQEAAYEVRYYLQQAEGYQMVECQYPLYAEIGETVTAEQKEFAGYVFNETKSNASGEVVKFKLTREVGEVSHLVLNMYYDIKTPQPPAEPVDPPYIPPTIDPVDPVNPADPIDPIEPQPLPPDDPLIEPIAPQPLPPDDPLIEDEDPKQPLPEDEHLIDPTNAGKAGDPDQPKTGDEAPLMALAGLFLASAGTLGAVYIKRKKEE